MNQDQTQMSGQVPTIPNVLLVHGAWADGSSWGGVIPLLRARPQRRGCPAFTQFARR
jgi:pimeloyl-ACP methyl ester carboxylesterase